MGEPIILKGDDKVVHAMNVCIWPVDCVGGFDFALMASQLLAVSLRATRDDTTKVMLGVSLRAR